MFSQLQAPDAAGARVVLLLVICSVVGEDFLLSDSAISEFSIVEP